MVENLPWSVRQFSNDAELRPVPVTRRTLLTGSAVAVPAILFTAEAPAYAVSAVTLAFSQSAYDGEACSTIAGVQVSAKEGGSPRPGVVITVSLSNGYTFSGGGTTSTGTTDAAGSFTLPAISVPSVGGTATAAATSSGIASAAASLRGTASTDARYLSTGTLVDRTEVPPGSTPVEAALFLTSDGRLLDTGFAIATNVDSCGQLWRQGSNWWMPLKKKDGSLTYIRSGSEVVVSDLPAGSTPVAGGIFLTPDGRLIDVGVGGTVYASNVVSFGQIWRSGSKWYLALKKNDGSNSYINSGYEVGATGVPSDSRPVGGGIFLATDGRLIDAGVGGTVIATNVASAGELFSPDRGANWRIPVIKRDGAVRYIETFTEKTPTGVPAGSTPVAYGMFLTSDGRIIDGASGLVYANNVGRVGRIYSAADDGNWRIPLNLRQVPAC